MILKKRIFCSVTCLCENWLAKYNNGLQGAFFDAFEYFLAVTSVRDLSSSQPLWFVSRALFAFFSLKIIKKEKSSSVLVIREQMTQFQTWLTRTKGALTRTRTKYEFFRLLTPSSANMGAKIYVFCKVGRPCPRWDFPMTQLALFPFSQVLPMKLKREWAAAISKPIGKGFVGNGAQRSSKYYTHIIARF